MYLNLPAEEQKTFVTFMSTSKKAKEPHLKAMRQAKPGIAEGLDNHRLNTLIADKKLGSLTRVRDNIYDRETKLTQQEISILMEKYENSSSSTLENAMRNLFTSSTHKEANEALLRNELRNSIKLLPEAGDDLTIARRISKFYPDNVLLDELKNMLQSGNIDKSLVRNYLRVLNAKAMNEGDSFGRKFVNDILTPLFSGDFKNMKVDDYTAFLKELRGINPSPRLIPIKGQTLAKFLSYNHNDATDWLKFLKQTKSQEASAEFFGLLDQLDVPAFTMGYRNGTSDALSVFYGDLKSMCPRQSHCFKYWEKNVNSFHSYHGGAKQAYSTLAYEDTLVSIKTKMTFSNSIATRILQCFNYGANVVNKYTMNHIWKAVGCDTFNRRTPSRFLRKNKNLTPLTHVRI